MDTNQDKQSPEDFLKSHIDKLESDKSSGNQRSTPQSTQMDTTRASDLEYTIFDVANFPCGKFYPQGTMFMIRPAKVKEIQSYSMVDDAYYPDVIEKMNDILQSCAKIKYPNGSIGTYLDIKDQDRIAVIFTIRELTFQKGNSLNLKVVCQHCNHENIVDLIRENFRFHSLDDKIQKYYNRQRNSFVFKVKSGEEFEITPPSIGLQKSFTEYIVKETSDGRKPSLSFLKIIPFMLNGINSLDYEDIKKKIIEFESMDDRSFQFLNSVVGKMTFGIKELVKRCENDLCGLEIRTPMQFPTGASGVFIIHDAFEEFIEE